MKIAGFALKDEQTQLLPCPNPWCGRSQPAPKRGNGVQKWIDWYEVLCGKCGTKGPPHPTKAAAIAAWNTRHSAETGEGGDHPWYDPAQPPPEGQPVLATYRAWNRPNGKPMKHVVWWWEGDWRIYPYTADRGHVDRWRPLASAPDRTAPGAA